MLLEECKWGRGGGGGGGGGVGGGTGVYRSRPAGSISVTWSHLYFYKLNRADS